MKWGKNRLTGPFCTASISLKLMELHCGHAPKGSEWKLSFSRAIDLQTFTQSCPLTCGVLQIRRTF